MKKIALIAIVFFALLSIASAQTFEYSYPAVQGQNALSLTHFSQAGYKYCIIDKPNSQIRLYNVNHSLYLTITIPPCGTYFDVFLLSDKLFNQNNDIEYLVHCISYNPVFSRVIGYDQSGNQFFYKDSAYLGNQDYDQVFNSSAVYYDGVKFKLGLSRNNGSMNGGALSHEVYDLPGSLPCISCTTFTMPGAGNVNGLTVGNRSQAEATFFPNPVTDQLKLKYHLPQGHKSAEIKIYDMQGKLVESFRVTDAFDELYLPAGFNNGSYLYSLIVDGEIVKTEKLILLK